MERFSRAKASNGSDIFHQKGHRPETRAKHFAYWNDP